MPKKKVDEAIEITPIQMASVKCHLIGTSPLIMHRFPKKAWEQLLFPKGRAKAWLGMAGNARLKQARHGVAGIGRMVSAGDGVARLCRQGLARRVGIRRSLAASGWGWQARCGPARLGVAR